MEPVENRGVPCLFFPPMARVYCNTFERSLCFKMMAEFTAFFAALSPCWISVWNR